MYPPSSRYDFCLPRLWSTNCKNGCLFKSAQRRNKPFSGVFNHGWCSSSIIWMHVNICGSHVSFYKKLILMRIFTRNYKKTLRSDEPCEFLKPKGFSLRNVFAKDLVLFLLDLFECFFFSQFKNLITGLFSSNLFLIIFLFAFIIKSCICICVVINIDLNWK